MMKRSNSNAARPASHASPSGISTSSSVLGDFRLWFQEYREYGSPPFGGSFSALSTQIIANKVSLFKHFSRLQPPAYPRPCAFRLSCVFLFCLFPSLVCNPTGPLPMFMVSCLYSQLCVATQSTFDVGNKHS